MAPDVRTHALLRIAGADALHCDAALPQWVAGELRRAPWVVVRRARARDELIPVGVRAEERARRCAAWLPDSRVLECVEPLELSARRAWTVAPRRTLVPALAALAAVERIMEALGFGCSWGPTGSVAFELASGLAAARAESDLDLIVQADGPLPPLRAAALAAELARLAVRTDTLLEGPAGAVSLEEYARGQVPLLLRTADGARLVRDPWMLGAAA
jgi:phosphoribosyl-dephospho-CoA transferase